MPSYTTASNQFAPGGFAAPRGPNDGMMQSLASGVNANATPLPNLDPNKIGANTPGVSGATDALARYAPGPWAPQVKNQLEGQGYVQAVGNQSYGIDPRSTDKPYDPLRDQIDQAQARTRGQVTGSEIESEGNEASQLRSTLQAAAMRSLTSRGFAPSSALGLNYASSADRQVAELMERRRTERETAARGQLTTLLAQQETRRANLTREQQTATNTQVQQDQYTTTMANQQREAELRRQQEEEQRAWWNPDNWTLKGVGTALGAGASLVGGNPLGALGILAGQQVGDKAKGPR